MYNKSKEFIEKFKGTKERNFNILLAFVIIVGLLIAFLSDGSK